MRRAAPRKIWGYKRLGSGFSPRSGSADQKKGRSSGFSGKLIWKTCIVVVCSLCIAPRRTRGTYKNVCRKFSGLHVVFVDVLPFLHTETNHACMKK
jgi:hypothetical protein